MGQDSIFTFGSGLLDKALAVHNIIGFWLVTG
jgi:hypothetical protein